MWSEVVESGMVSWLAISAESVLGSGGGREREEGWRSDPSSFSVDIGWVIVVSEEDCTTVSSLLSTPSSLVALETDSPILFDPWVPTSNILISRLTFSGLVLAYTLKRKRKELICRI